MTDYNLKRANNIKSAIKAIEKDMDTLNQMLVCDYTVIELQTKNAKSTDDYATIKATLPYNIRKMVLEEALYSRERQLRELNKKFEEIWVMKDLQNSFIRELARFLKKWNNEKILIRQLDGKYYISFESNGDELLIKSLDSKNDIVEDIVTIDKGPCEMDISEED